MSKEASELTTLMLRAMREQQASTSGNKSLDIATKTSFTEDGSRIVQMADKKLPTNTKAVSNKVPVKKVVPKKTALTKVVTKKPYPAKSAAKASIKTGKEKAKK